MRLRILVGCLLLTFPACSTITDNIDIDVDGIIAATCENFAEQLSRQVESQLSTITDQSEVAIPDIDIEGAIDRASELGCSPEDMRSLISENLETIETTSDRARSIVSDLQEQAEG